MPATDRPRCAQCDRVLRRHAHQRVLWHAGTLDPPVPAGAVITRRHAPVLEETGHATYWLPADGFGYRGESIFCSLRCGYRWAMRTVRGLRQMQLEEDAPSE